MGCDIHIFREAKRDNLWVCVDLMVDEDGWKHRKECYDARNYQLFGVLSNGVRDFSYPFSFEQRGIPDDISDEVQEEEPEGLDYHSHNYITLQELKDFYTALRIYSIYVSGMMPEEQWIRLRDSICLGNPQWDSLYPYCQATNMKNYIHFGLFAPAQDMIGKSIKQLIDSFDGIEGDDFRFIFWFDN